MDYAAKSYRRVLFVGNRRLLITQARNDAERFSIPHGVIMADCDGGESGSTNQIASIQTLESWYFCDSLSARVPQERLPEFNLIIIDEGHQDEERYRKLLQNYPEAKVLVLTATPVGAQGRSLVPNPYEVMLEPITNSQLIEQGVLLPTTVYAPSEPNIEGVKIEGQKEYNQGKLGRAVKTCTVFADVFGEWERYQDRATVCFVPGVAYGRDLVSQFNYRLGGTLQRPKAYLIEAKTKHGEREEIFGRINEAQKGIVVSVDVLREGFDLPVLSCGLDLQPNSQLRGYWQKLGRVKRAFSGQSKAIWLDFAGNYWRFPHPDDDPEWPQGTETTQDAIGRRRDAEIERKPVMCPKCGLVRRGGPVCPGCGHQAPSEIRRIRMGGGELKEIPADDKRLREEAEAIRLYKKWKSRIYLTHRNGQTFGQAAIIFSKETGQSPRKDWPFVFGKGSLDWKRKPSDEYDTRQLLRRFS